MSAKKQKRASTEFKQYASQQQPGETLTEWYKRLAQTANKRLERAEKYQQQEYFKPATKWAYAVAQHDIKKFRGEGKRKFAPKASGSEAQIRSQINAMRKYLAMPTSTKQGIIAVYQKRVDTINKDSGTNFTWQQFASFIESENWKNWEDKFGSATAFKTIGIIQKNQNKIIKAMEQQKKIDIRVDDDVLNDTIKMALDDEKLDILSLFT